MYNLEACFEESELFKKVNSKWKKYYFTYVYHDYYDDPKTADQFFTFYKNEPMNYKYEVEDIVLNNNNQIGIIEEKGISRIDHTDIPSYWVKYTKDVHPDGDARNTWESSIKRKLDKHCITCKNNDCCLIGLTCIPQNYKYHETISST